ncbi:S41 family peptidase [Candidatus Gottesmanbacteria bacterium]|nr:S41 family peptidase [Candidatus Gottesmanbacteria bacterium]
MKTLPFSKIRNFVFLLALLILSAGIGFRLGEKGYRLTVTTEKKVVVNQNPPATITADFSVFWDVWQKLTRYYIDAATLDSGKMVEGAVTGMVNSLGDPYTIYLPPKDNKDFKEDLGGAFEGIGAQLGTKDAHIIVVAPLKGTPAEKAGLRPGDWIIKVNGEETAGWTVPATVTKIRGPRGTSVALEILHEGESAPVAVSILRDTIMVPSVDSWVKPISQVVEISTASGSATFKNRSDVIGYLRLSRFGDRTNDEWNTAVADILGAQLRLGKMKGIILDLRNNPGGYLDGSVFIASEFVKSGTVVSQVNSDGTKQDFPVNRRGKLTDVPLVVLVNRGSASAAEIVAGALRDLRHAKLVGETTFGKGTVQTPYELSGGAGVHITTGKWLLPSGVSITKVGVKPDVEIIRTTSGATDDTQLAKAIELLLQ